MTRVGAGGISKQVVDNMERHDELNGGEKVGLVPGML